MATPTTDYTTSIKNTFNDIEKLKETPEIIKNIALTSLENVSKQSSITNSTKQVVNNSIATLRNISNSSVEENYKIIYLQMCVLAVSAIEAQLKKYFSNAFNHPKNINANNKRLAEVRFTVKELLDLGLTLKDKLGRVYLEKEKLNFQDLQSIKHIFRDYLNKELNLNQDTEKKLCFYFECRHVIVHRGGKVDAKFLAAMTPLSANIKNFLLGDDIIFDVYDWENMKMVFVKLIEDVTRQRA